MEHSQNQHADELKAPTRQPRKTLYLNAGHGGFIQMPNGRMVYATAGKRYRHINSTGQPLAEFHGEGWIYEGVLNREYSDIISRKLAERYPALEVVVMHDQNADTPRLVRIGRANKHYQQLQKEGGRGCWLGLHFNAANGAAQGIVIFTSVGETASDKWAKMVSDELIARGIQLWDKDEVRAGIAQTATIRHNKNDADHEKDFDEVANTNCPAILMEGGFFDNFRDAQMIFSPEFKAIYTDALVASIAKFLDLGAPKQPKGSPGA
jgi:N-acetylmuramoyl-L-alanine amidase